MPISSSRVSISPRRATFERRPWKSTAGGHGCARPHRQLSLALTFVYPEITQPGGGGSGQAGDEDSIDADGIPERSLVIRLSYQLTVASLEISGAITNRARRPVTFKLAWILAADFADIQEAQAGRREQDAEV